MHREELDRVLQVMENPVRRQIIKRLSQESCYALQLSKELGLGQPLVAKHLGVMEKAGLVTSVSEISPSGPPRKKYSLSRGLSITLDVGPNIFIERGASFESGSKREASQRGGLLRQRYREAAETKDGRARLSLLSDLLGEVDERLEEMEDERGELLDIRNRTMSEAAQIVNKLERLDMRRVLFHILDEHDREVESISEALNLREVAVRGILEELERDYFE